jgi:hypothetical protein
MTIPMGRQNGVPGLAGQNASRKMAGPTVELHGPNALHHDLIEIDRGNDEARHHRSTPNLAAGHCDDWQRHGRRASSVRRAVPYRTRSLGTRDAGISGALATEWRGARAFALIDSGRRGGDPEPLGASFPLRLSPLGVFARPEHQQQPA